LPLVALISQLVVVSLIPATVEADRLALWHAALLGLAQPVVSAPLVLGLMRLASFAGTALPAVRFHQKRFAPKPASRQL
jgi:hypothetical protein